MMMISSPLSVPQRRAFLEGGEKRERIGILAERRIGLFLSDK